MQSENKTFELETRIQVSKILCHGESIGAKRRYVFSPILLLCFLKTFLGFLMPGVFLAVVVGVFVRICVLSLSTMLIRGTSSELSPDDESSYIEEQM